MARLSKEQWEELKEGTKLFTKDGKCFEFVDFIYSFSKELNKMITYIKIKDCVGIRTYYLLLDDFENIFNIKDINA